jgi:hypothetical protein
MAMSEPRGEDGRHPLERTIEIFVYAPIGALLDAHRLLPQAVDRGRQEVEGFLGWFGRRVQGARDEAAAGLRGLGVVEDRGRDEPTRLDAPAPSPAEERIPVEAEPAPAPRVLPSPPDGDRPAVDDLAIPDYDSLSASQVVPRLTGLGDHELEQVRRYEAGGRGRRTILSRIAQLQQG